MEGSVKKKKGGGPLNINTKNDYLTRLYIAFMFFNTDF